MLNDLALEPVFKQLALVGVSPITSSIALAARAAKAAGQVVVANVPEPVPRHVADGTRVEQRGESAFSNIKSADLVIVSAPADECCDVDADIGPLLAPGAVVSNLCTKPTAAVGSGEQRFPKHVHPIPVHLIVGIEATGCSNSAVFAGCTCILVPPASAEAAAVARLSKFWRALGAHVVLMTSDQRDIALAITKYIPRLIAYSIARVARGPDSGCNALIEGQPDLLMEFSAEAMESDPLAWRDIFIANRASILASLSMVMEDVAILSKLIRRESADNLLLELMRGSVA
jgi:cyclohexadieny/prephenate dehydrogenase